MTGVRNMTVKAGEAEMRLDRWFKAHFPELAFGRLQKLLRTGQIRVDGARAKTNQRLEPGQTVRVPPFGAVSEEHDHETDRWHETPEKTYTITPEDADFVKSLVVYGDNEVLVINKPAGLAVQGGTKTERHLDGMLPALAEKDGETPRLVHRLDRDTSGVMMLAKTREAANRIGQAFKAKETRKIYWAITAGVPDPREGEISMALSKAGGPGQERVVADPEEGKSAITWYKVIDTAGSRAALVALWPRTGRTHQLRAHMAALGAPIVGDGKYGGKNAFLTGEDFPKQVHLHAREIDVPGKGARIAAPLPDHMRQTLALLGLDTEDLVLDPFEEWEAPKPQGRKSGAGRAVGGKSTARKPTGGKPSGGKTTGGKPTGGKPVGKAGSSKPRTFRSAAARSKSPRGKGGGTKRR